MILPEGWKPVIGAFPDHLGFRTVYRELPGDVWLYARTGGVGASGAYFRALFWTDGGNGFDGANVETDTIEDAIHAGNEWATSAHTRPALPTDPETKA